MNKLILILFASMILCGCEKNSAKEPDKVEHAEPPAPEPISEQALTNMGVEVKEVDSSTFIIPEQVPAIVTETPFNELPVFAPFAGRVKNINVKLGSFVEKGETLLTIIREPIPKIELKLIEELLKTAAQNLYTRIYIESNEEMDEKSKNIISSDLWKKALEQNGIWDNSAERIYATLPKALKKNQWSIATIGELTAERLLSEELIKWFEEDRELGTYIAEIGGLVQNGYTIENLKYLHSIGVFNPIITIKAPTLKSNWDVESIQIKAGEKVEAGTSLITLSNHESMFLIAKPAGSETTLLNNAVKKGSKIIAKPLVPGAAPKLTNLVITKIMGRDDGGSHVYIPIKNVVLNKTESDGAVYRNWTYRNEMKFIIQVPVKILEDVIVLPSEAVIKSGTDKVIFVKEGDDFIKRKVVVLFQDEEFVVLGEGSEVFPEEPMVIHGSFALNMALLADGPQKIDAHANCDHQH